MTTLRLGTRRSPLALHQAHLTQSAIAAVAPDIEVELVEITSDGDRDPRDLREIGERGIFAHALERALREGSIDAAVHSSKDLALDPSDDLELVAWLAREDPRDALVGRVSSLEALEAGDTVATGSARREAAIRTVAPAARTLSIRGNVQTRIDRSIERGDAACMLAMAGLVRLGIAQARSDVHPVPVHVVVPEAGQGAVVVQARSGRCARTGFDWASIDHVATRRTVTLERSLARALGGGCEQPVGVHVELDAGCIHVFGAAALGSGGRYVHHDAMGLELANLLSVRAPSDIDDAAQHAAGALAPELARQLGLAAQR